MNSNDHSLAAPSQYLTFNLGAEQYGIDILRIQEIRGVSSITPVPNTPSFLRGVMNLRGAIIPVIDLRTRFGLPAVEYDRFKVILIISSGKRSAGLVVDAVSDVLKILQADIQLPPEIGDAGSGFAIHGLANSGDSVVLLIDVDRVLTHATSLNHSEPAHA